jgi:hypothetical protein
MRLTIECPQGHKTGNKVNILNADLSAILPLPTLVVGEHFHLSPLIFTCPAGERYRFGPGEGITVSMEAIA